MNTLSSQLTCARCNGALDATDNYCRRCGTPTALIAGRTAGQGQSWPAKPSSWWESPVVVLVLLFAVLGPFALPLLWQSRRFNPVWKAILTVVVLAFTMWLCWKVWSTVNQLMAPMQDVFKQLR